MGYRVLTRRPTRRFLAAAILPTALGVAAVARHHLDARAYSVGATPSASTPHLRPEAERVGSSGALQSITAFQLATVGVTLGSPAPGTPSVDAAQADAAAQAVVDQPVIETALAACTNGSAVDQSCWAVSLQPPAGTSGAWWGGPAAAYSDGASSPLRFELVLVDAASGSVMTVIGSSVPPAPPGTSGG